MNFRYKSENFLSTISVGKFAKKTGGCHAMIPYVKIENSEALESRKNLLSTQMNLLHISQKIVSYKKLRKREIVKKSSLKRSLRQKMLLLNSLLASLPQGEVVGVKSIKHEAAKYIHTESSSYKKGSKKSREIESQLQEIQEKLSKM
ncbi:MAG: hypothetical protein ABH840_04295 [Nanoarchaeota archaeon]